MAKSTGDANLIALYTHLLLGSQLTVKHHQRRLAAMVKEAQQNGVSWPEVRAALKEFDATPEQRRARAERQGKIYEAIGVPAQLEMFDAYVPRDNDSDVIARKKGFFAAVCHAACEPPYDAGSSEGQAWIAGWHQLTELVDGYNKRFNVEEGEEGFPDNEAAREAAPE